MYTAGMAAADVLTKRWTEIPHHPEIYRLWTSPHRFNVVPAGRRSYKTETRKRKVVWCALTGINPYTLQPLQYAPRLFCAAPTRDQAKRIFWADLKAMVPAWAMKGKPSETELVIRLKNGAEIHVVGMDKPQRIEGSPWDGGVLDEYANMKAEAWGANVRPALSDRMGWCDAIGVPEGRNHYYDLYESARAEMLELGVRSSWGAFTWKSSDVLPVEEIEAARRDLDELTFQQEYEASFVNFVGRAYYPFVDAHKQKLRDRYRPTAMLDFSFDFNVAPGVACVSQEMELPNGEIGTGVIGEVWIPANSNTPAVCRRLIKDWGEHMGPISVYGDASGGAKGTAKVHGSDWDLVRSHLRAHFGDRVRYRVPASNPAERVRVNALNSRIEATDGTIRLMVDPKHAPHVVKDLDGVRVLEGGSGELEKKPGSELTHISDALGYRVVRDFPTTERRGKTIHKAVA